jgi:hypothetical protein
MTASSTFNSHCSCSGFTDAGGYKGRFRDHERLLTAPDIDRYNVILRNACREQGESDAGLEGW